MIMFAMIVMALVLLREFINMFYYYSVVNTQLKEQKEQEEKDIESLFQAEP